MKLRRQLLLVSLVALALPWAGCQYLRQVDAALAQGQLQALEATAAAIAARLASAPQLIAPDPLRQARPPGAQLYLNPLPQAPFVDGYGDEWRSLALKPRALLDAQRSPLAQVTLGQFGERVYLLLTVSDPTPAYHDPRTGLLSAGDTVELYTGNRHYTLPVASQGAASALWHDPRAGHYERELRLHGRWTTSPTGYQLELALPYALTGGALSIQVRDRAHSDGGAPVRAASTLPADGIPGHLVRPLADLHTELEHFVRPGLRLAVVDSEGFLLASHGQLQINDKDGEPTPWLRNWIYRKLLAQEDLSPLAVSGLPASAGADRTPWRQWFSGPLQSRIGAVSVPVITRADDVVERPLLGRVLVLQSGAVMQSVTEGAAHRLWLISCAAAATALLLLLAYASWLSWRIRKLHRAARTAVDASGKLRGDFPISRAGDELGALNRTFASLLSELDQYHQYLRTLAGKLSHELRTPLAIVRSSLDNLCEGNLDKNSRRYAERAMDGSARLSGILNSLSAASNLEASIQQAEREPFDLADFLKVMVQCYSDAHPNFRFHLDVSPGELICHGAPELLAQLLDKLVDNACSFAPAGSEIQLSAHTGREGYTLSVSNRGPLLPGGSVHKLFDSLVSVRKGGNNTGHLGLGLHIAKLIADFHRGRLRAGNRADGSGVVFCLELPAR
ncbi:ATP-binding protein [Microbulbifer sp. 2205BS26-8]|uniref:ATP-binding protein n=1 Tax=Microbulbifer sp. 2205BS26-8 TaxID=3064386 RepID=UPI00273E280F|nr:ATP-binding protein [Microbulbifer sp. 2205BS26-8]MDP5208454.1 ATP-binding protein [Microbulbifer sp. 2205BS26-8]